MAKNWKMGEAVRAVKSGNKEDIMDIGRRFPLFLSLAAQVNEAGALLIDCVPDYCTARKIESVLKGDVQETEKEDEVEDEPAKEAPKKEKKTAKEKKAPEKEQDDDDDDLESKSTKELFNMCKKAGLNVKPKQDKEVYIKALKDAENGAEDDDWDDAEDEEEAPKKPAKKADKKAAPKKDDDDDDDDDDDWDV